MPNTPEQIAERLSEAQREAVLQSETWDGEIMKSPLLLSLNVLELLHVVVVKNGDGIITHAGARLTPLGLAVRDSLLHSTKGPDHAE